MEKLKRLQIIAKAVMEELFDDDSSSEGSENQKTKLHFSSEEFDLDSLPEESVSIFCWGMYTGFDWIVNNPKKEDSCKIIDLPSFQEIIERFAPSMPICIGVDEVVNEVRYIAVYFLSEKQLAFLDKEF